MKRLGLDRRAPGSLIVQSFDDVPLEELARQLPPLPRTFLIDRRNGVRRVTDNMPYYLSELDVDALFTDNPDRFPR